MDKIRDTLPTGDRTPVQSPPPAEKIDLQAVEIVSGSNIEDRFANWGTD